LGVDLKIWGFEDLKICPTYNFQIRNFQIPNWLPKAKSLQHRSHSNAPASTNQQRTNQLFSAG